VDMKKKMPKMDWKLKICLMFKINGIFPTF
jgi:hypothetical protein